MTDLSNIEKQIKSDEDGFPKLRQNIGKKILWAGKSSQKTPLSIVSVSYTHLTLPTTPYV